MAGNYNVDDILAEIERKKGSAQGGYQPPATGVSAKKAESAFAASQFNMRGMSGQKQEASPFSKPQQEQTRTDLPTVKAAPARQPASDRTQVMPAITNDPAADFERSRQQKVKQFMQNSFAAEPPETASMQMVEEEAAEDGDIGNIGRFFGGLNQTGYKPEAEPEKTKSKKDGKGKASSKGKGKKGSGPKSLAPVKGDKDAGLKKSAKKKKADDRDDDGEYTEPSDARDVRDDIRALKKSLTTRVVVTGICCAALLYLALANLYPIPLLNAICPEVDMKIFLMVNLMVLVIAALAANAVIGNGLVSFFTLKADYDSAAALCTLAVIAHGVALVMNPDNLHTGEGGFYFVIAAMTLFANSIGKRLMISRIERNFAAATSGERLQGEYIVEDADTAARLAQGQGFAEATIAYSAPIGFPEKFLKLSYSDEYTENLSRYLSHFFAVAALVLAVTCRLFFDCGTMEAFSIFCVVLCMASPLTPTLIGNLPLLRASKGLAPQGAFISGYDAVETFEEMNCAAVKASELYPRSSVELHAIQPLAESRIDEAILDAVSVSVRINGLLSEVLLGMVGGNHSILLPVDEVRYETGAGVIANVAGKTVMIGRRSLMERYKVAIPPPQYEKKLTKGGGKKALYVANSGVVTAMLVVAYRPGRNAVEWVNRLGKKELGLLVYTTNPNITVKKISSDFRYPPEFIRIMPEELHDDFAALTAPRERGKAYIVSPVGSEARLHALAAVHSVKQAIVFGTVIQMAGLILGYALTAFLSFTGAIATLGFGQLALYQLFWAVAALLLSNLKKI